MRYLAAVCLDSNTAWAMCMNFVRTSCEVRTKFMHISDAVLLPKHTAARVTRSIFFATFTPLGKLATKVKKFYGFVTAMYI